MYGHIVSSCLVVILYSRSRDLPVCSAVPQPLRHRVVCSLNPLNAELNPICHLLALLGGATIVDVSGLSVNYQECKVHAPYCAVVCCLCGASLSFHVISLTSRISEKGFGTQKCVLIYFIIFMSN
jgi:hypothetical protein